MKALKALRPGEGREGLIKKSLSLDWQKDSVGTLMENKNFARDRACEGHFYHENSFQGD